MDQLSQGDVAFFNLNPTLGVETKKSRPCLIISNDNYNAFFNTVIILPISSASKYYTNEKFVANPSFVEIFTEEVHGTILLQHIRTIDPLIRRQSKVLCHLNKDEMTPIIDTIKKFL